MLIFRLAAALATVALFPACASVLAGTHKTVRVTSEPPGAIVRLNGTARGVTPAKLHPSTRSDHTVSIELAGYHPHTVRLVRKLSAWQWANIVTGLAPGIAFDGITGAVYSFHPGEVHADLVPLGERRLRRPTSNIEQRTPNAEGR